jgi:DNA-binding FadR family transcriptional regulator
MLISVDHPGREDTAHRLRSFIADGRYQPGDRLPPERQLIEMLQVTRSSLRRALERLENEGAIWRHVGKGTFVGPSGVPVEDELLSVAHQMTPIKLMRARLSIEPALAREAAINASGEAVAQIFAATKRAQASASWTEYERQDDAFHRAIAEASDNLLLVTLYHKLNQVQRAVAWATVQRTTARPDPKHSSFIEHDAIAKAIKDCDPDAAFRAMRKHLNSVSYRLFGDD